MIRPLNIFYEEPENDRWFKHDHYPRKIIRRIVRGKHRLGGVETIAINLMKGLDKLSIPYRFNDYRYIKKHPKEIACIIGKPHVFFNKAWNNPIILGAGIYSHPVEHPDLFKSYPNIKRVLVPGKWMQNMFEPYYGDKVLAWPTGIDTSFWSPVAVKSQFDFLIYDKPLWNPDEHIEMLLNPIIKHLKSHKFTFTYIKYGNYTLNQLLHLTHISKACIFLSPHETQGLAYQQILSANTPILAYDRGGFWQDPYYYPHKVKFEPVSSVPYWDDRCGLKFSTHSDFEDRLNIFLAQLDNFKPREYIKENLSLEVCAEKYLSIYKQVEQELNNEEKYTC